MAHGVRATMSLPMPSGETAVGALDFSGGTDGAFDGAPAQVGARFAAQATVVLVNAQADWGVRLQSGHPQQALVGRELIDVAKGIVMNAYGVRAGRGICHTREAVPAREPQAARRRRRHRCTRPAAPIVT